MIMICCYINMDYPVAEKIPYQVEFGNVEGQFRGEDQTVLIDPPITLTDNYYWMRDDTRQDDKVLKHLKAEADYCQKYMSDTKDLQESLYKELLSRVKETNDSLPCPHGENGWNCDFYYFTRTIQEMSYPIHCRIDNKTKEIQILLDENLIAKGMEQCDISNFTISPNHKLMAYGLDDNGSEKYQVFIKDIETNTSLIHNIPKLMYCDYSWYDNNNIFYSTGDSENRMYQVWHYRLDTRQSKLIYETQEKTTRVGYHFSDDKKYLFISESTFDCSEEYFLDLKQMQNSDVCTLKLVSKKQDDRLYNSYFHRDSLFILTNRHKDTEYPNFTLFRQKSDDSSWESFLPYNDDVYIESVSFLNNHMLISQKIDGNNVVRIINYVNGKYETDQVKFITIPNAEINCQISYFDLDIYDTDTIWFHYSSMLTQTSTYELNLCTGKTSLLRKAEVPNYNSSLYRFERLEASSKDATLVPISLIYHKEKFKGDGSNPLFLYGYGSYGHTVIPDFDSNVFPLLDRGWVYAIAHVRGGSFRGYSWYLDGKMKKKKNTFDDFNSCAEYLAKNKYTSTDRITANGRSAGGLLVGAAMTSRPDLYHCVIAGVPFLDLMNTMCDSTIPLTIPEWEQWGNPNIKEDFDYMISYSPYDNLKPGSYPHFLATTGLHDPRVGYWEPAKFVARLREVTNPDDGEKARLLRIELSEGHFSASDRYKYLRETAFEYAFAIKMLEI